MCVSAGGYTKSRCKNAFFFVGHSQNNLKESVMGDSFPSSFSFTRRDICLILPQFNAIQRTSYWAPTTWGWSLGWGDPLEKGKAPHSSILARRIPWTVIVHGVTKSWTRLSDFHFLTSLHYVPGPRGVQSQAKQCACPMHDLKERVHVQLSALSSAQKTALSRSAMGQHPQSPGSSMEKGKQVGKLA